MVIDKDHDSHSTSDNDSNESDADSYGSDADFERHLSSLAAAHLGSQTYRVASAHLADPASAVVTYTNQKVDQVSYKI